MTNPLSTDGAKICANRAYEAALAYGHRYVTIEHLLGSLLLEQSVQTAFQATKVDLQNLLADLTAYLNGTTNPPAVNNARPRITSGMTRVINRALAAALFSGRRDLEPCDLIISIFDEVDCYALYFMQKNNVKLAELKKYLSHGRAQESSDEEEDEDDNEERKLAKAEKLLKKYCVLLNETASEGKIDPLIGRETEVKDLSLVLARRSKNNVILVGEPGVGKTAIAEGLALKITKGEVPAILTDSKVYSLDLGKVIAGTKFRGDMEERIKQILDALRLIKNPILFIDEIHMIMGAGGGGQQGSMDVSNLLKPALARGEIHCIGATTFDEYRKHFEKDRALMRRFQKLDVKEPSVADAKRILAGVAPSYASFHGVAFSPEALEAAVDLTHRYVMDKMLPDKAIDVLDRAGARKRILPNPDNVIWDITTTDIQDEVATIARIPSTSVKEDDTAKLSRLEDDLKTVVFDQDSAVTTLVDAIMVSKAGLREPNKPQGSYLFVGPTGVGKTEVAKQLAKTLGIELIRFDMSEYMEKHSVSKLIGAPPGYVGFGDGQSGSGLLTNAVEQTPYCVLLLDEVEKAHVDVFNILLQVMDDGRLTSGSGKTIDFQNVILIMTSNAGARDMERHGLGFGQADRSGDDDKAVNNLFSPEFRNRLDKIVKFTKLQPTTMGRIVDKFLAQLVGLAKGKNVDIRVNPDAKDWLATKGYDPAFGARPLSRVINENVKQPLAREMLFGGLKLGGTAVVDVLDGKLVVRAEAPEAVPAKTVKRSRTKKAD